MKSLRQHRATLQKLQDRVEDCLSQVPGRLESAMPRRESEGRSFAITAVWVAAGASIIALGIVAGRELRLRYKLARRTPYDYYGHAGDSTDADFVVGV